MTCAAVVIPFRSRGTDYYREQNLSRVRDQWESYGYPLLIVDDGRSGDDQFNRSAAYNRGVRQADGADVLVFSESDMLIDLDAIENAIDIAKELPGLVIPFSEFRALSEEDSLRVRDCQVDPEDCATTIIRGYRGSIGAINVVSRRTYSLIGCYDETFEGAWYDDDAMKIAFEVCAGPTRWVDGPAYHLYHLPSGRGDHLSDRDRGATWSNRRRFRQYQKARTPEQVRMLTCSGFRTLR